MGKITKQMKIDDVLKKYPKTIGVFIKNGFHCIGCAAVSFENIEDGAKAHGIAVEGLIEELNEAVREK